MPNEELHGRTVVASVWLIDDPDRDPEVLVLLLNPTAPFFSVATTNLYTGSLVILGSHENIVPAVRQYEDEGGDY
jgi:hypothetical protein